MLDLCHEQQLIAELWETTETKIQISESMQKDFFEVQGPTPRFYDNKRSFHRFFMRGKAVLKRRDTVFGAVTKDVSRQGVGFLSPVQLMPKERIDLRVPTAELRLEVARCRRIDKGCFDCGARFVL